MESQNHNKQNPLWRETDLSPTAAARILGARKLSHYQLIRRVCVGI
jgi:hypothetical protein